MTCSLNQMRFAYLFTHRRHILPSNFASLQLANEQTYTIIFSNYKHKRIADATVSDLGSRLISIPIFDSLSFSTIWDVVINRILQSITFYSPGSNTLITLVTLNITCKMAVP